MPTMEEIIGRQQIMLENLNENYSHLLGVMAKVANGEVSPDRLTVDLDELSWKVKSIGTNGGTHGQKG
ncbi:hypothetical protein LCGC14_1804110 [marine sediment metagenome]|uniref:Uncharacterized protein n=1 Tax=marine sediment metagenome TaxID=412755 RepID=A0A0F9HBK7_9ZZZZ